MIEAIYNRRSIRKYLDTPISKDDIIDIINSAMKAPSSKNRQPWKYIVIQGNAKTEMIKAFEKGMLREETKEALLPMSKKHIPAAKYTIEILKQAPVVIFVVNSSQKGMLENLEPEERVYNICNIQSISASVQNMLLSATEKGIESLWVCDIFFAYKELCDWLNEDGELICAVALGYPDEDPKERPRKKFDDVVEWRN